MITEEQVLEFWRDHDIFKKTLEKDSPGGNFVFYDGPPFATGLPHYGHILVSSIKDCVPRYQTMKGKRVERRWGWDCHGLPIENIVEKDLGISGKKEIEDLGIEKFNDYARTKVLTYVSEWKKTIDRIGRWVDFDGSYKTMDNTYIESVWWGLKQVYSQGLIYRGTRVLPYCPRCETPIANSEIAMDNSYKTITDISVYVRLRLRDEPNTSLLAWTTTPWTLPANSAAGVNPDLDYIKIKDGSSYYIIAKDRFSAIEKFFDQPEVIETISGQALVGQAYEPIFNYYSLEGPQAEKAWRIYGADYVTTETGTGIVHLAPAYGEIDMELAKANKIPYFEHVGLDGRLKKELGSLAGLKVKTKNDNQSTDVEIIKLLHANGSLFAEEKVSHSYPHCFRCETPLYYTAVPAWFIKIEPLRKKLLDSNEDINWIPSHLKHGRFYNTVATAPDWNISRNRYWASPLPIWQCTSCQKLEVIGSIDELKEKAINFKSGLNQQGELDLHRPYVDRIKIKCICGQPMTRTVEVLDAWFESGSMPYAQNHYPFENKDQLLNRLPAQFVSEYVAQTRTWFYYMHVVSNVLFNNIPFENVLTTGTVLAEDGQKMSKSKGNFPDPWLILNKYGADALRFYLLSSPVMRSEDLNFSEKGVDEIYKKIILRLHNIISFYELYRPSDVENKSSDNILDRWISDRLNETISDTTKAMDSYQIDQALKPIEKLIDDLSTWYLRRSRERLRSQDPEALYAFVTVLRTMARLVAPFIPFVAEGIYQIVKEDDQGISVHLENWPTAEPVKSPNLINDMGEARRVVSLGLEARSRSGIKVRQPLASITIKDTVLKSKDELVALLKDELNVKEVRFDPTQADDIMLDTEINLALKEEGMVRDIIRLVQEARKKAGYTFNKEVKLIVKAPINVDKVKDKIEKETTTTIVDALDKTDSTLESDSIKVIVGQ